MLRVEGLRFGYDGRDLWLPLSLAASAGNRIWIRGTNGAGKSTLLALLAGLKQPVSGSVAWQVPLGQSQIRLIGHELPLKKYLTVAEMRLRFGALFGTPQGDSIALDVEDVPDNAFCHTLSAGNRQRLALSSLLYGTSHVWLLDEAHSHLDTQAQQILEEMIRFFTKSGGLLIYTRHDPSPTLPDQIIVLERPIKDGTDRWAQWT
jgi:heme exporter protein A